MILGPDGVCPDCGQECQFVVVNNGIGWYEYWGAKYYDDKPEAVSDCCEVPVDGVGISDLEER